MIKNHPHLHSTNSYKKARNKFLEQDLELHYKNPIENIINLKYSSALDTIRNVSYDPFWVHYWSNEQMFLYKRNSEKLCIDTTGSLMKKIKFIEDRTSSHLFLYECVCRGKNNKSSVSNGIREA